MSLFPNRLKLIWFHMTYGRVIELKQERTMINRNFCSTIKNTPNQPTRHKFLINQTMIKVFKVCLTCWVSQTLSHTISSHHTHSHKDHFIKSIILMHLSSLSWLRQAPVTANNKDFSTLCSVPSWSTTWPSRNMLKIKYTRIFTLNCINIYKLINIIIDIVLILRINS